MFRIAYTNCLSAMSKRLDRNASSSASMNVDVRQPFRLVTLDKEHYEDATDIVHRNSFPTEDVRKPSAVGLNFLDICGEISSRHFEESVSRILYDAPSEQAVGVIISRVAKEKELCLPLSSAIHPGTKAILTSLQALEQQIAEFRLDNAASGMQILYLGVLEAHRGRGIGRLLVSNTIDFARQNGAAFIQTYAATSEVASLFHGLGFETLGKLRLMDHFIDGSAAFPNATSGDELSYLAKFL